MEGLHISYANHFSAVEVIITCYRTFKFGWFIYRVSILFPNVVYDLYCKLDFKSK